MYKLILQSSRRTEPEPATDDEAAAGAEGWMDGCSLHGGPGARGSDRASYRQTPPAALDILYPG